MYTFGRTMMPCMMDKNSTRRRCQDRDSFRYVRLSEHLRFTRLLGFSCAVIICYRSNLVRTASATCLGSPYTLDGKSEG